VISAVASFVLGWIALTFYFFSYCWNGSTDCAAYSPTRRWIAFLLAPPIFLMQKWFFGTVDNVPNFDPVFYGRYGWAVLWTYYLLLTDLTFRMVKRLRRRKA